MARDVLGGDSDVLNDLRAALASVESNVELAHAENITTPTTTVVTPTWADLPGLIITFKVPERPYVVEFWAAKVSHTAATSGVGLRLMRSDDGGNSFAQVSKQDFSVTAANGSYGAGNMRRRESLTAGSMVTYKVQFTGLVAGTSYVTSAATHPAFLRATKV
jgi:hypothetical protein